MRRLRRCSRRQPTTTPEAPPPPHLLIVEHDLAVRLTFAEYLRECGYKVFEAVDTDEAVAILEGGVRIDILLCDARSPGRFDGFRLAQWIRSGGYTTDVILAGTIERAAEKVSDLCEDGPMDQPYHHLLLVGRIKRLLAGRDRHYQ